MPTGNKPKAKPRTKTAKKKAPPKMSLDKRIKAISLKQAETKVKTWRIFDAAEPINFGLQVGTNAKGLLEPNILGGSIFSMAQGTNQQQRIGNSISNCKLNIRGYVFSLPVNGTTNTSVYPYQVKLIIYKLKDAVTGSPNELLQYPNNTNGPFTGDTSTLLFPYNRKSYVIKKVVNLRLKSNPIASVSTVSDVVGVENPAFYGSADQANRFFNFSVPIKDVLQFDDEGTIPSNEWCSFGVCVHNGDGAVITTGRQKRCKVTAFATLRYKDF